MNRDQLIARKIEIEEYEIPKFVRLLQNYSATGLPHQIDKIAQGATGEAIALMEAYQIVGIPDAVEKLAELRNEVTAIEKQLSETQ